MGLSFPWETGPKAADPDSIKAVEPAAEAKKPPKPRGRRPAGALRAVPLTGSPAWRYHHLTVFGPADSVAAFAGAARGAGVIPWHVDLEAIEEDIFNLAAAQPAASRNLTIAGCRILARQFRDRVAQRQAMALARVGQSTACPFDLHALLPVPEAILALGPTHPAALAWLTTHWGVTDQPRKVATLQRPKSGRRLPKNHAVIGYEFFTADHTPRVAVAALRARWPNLRTVLQLRRLD